MITVGGFTTDSMPDSVNGATTANSLVIANGYAFAFIGNVLLSNTVSAPYRAAMTAAALKVLGGSPQLMGKWLLMGQQLSRLVISSLVLLRLKLKPQTKTLVP